ncbi:cupin domain-containing protein [Chondrinema litorale]|uniref:cupin domain-containing protein n=1 Tax=Chondrinema litorale TaxID=2994555 RepID=UPI0025439EF4|nr:cupin domain-containing protein [Chondrinema litorale]UZR96908.1 cupin domain-containing protein [Chondrinema litorale]
MENRREFIAKSGFCGFAHLFGCPFFAFIDMTDVTPTKYYFEDDGIIPNSKYPLLIYQSAFNLKGNEGANWLEKHFKANNWFNSWRWGVYPFHHYHSTTHEVLGCFQGSALLHLGGEKGEKIQVKGGDIIVIPAGVGHKCISHSNDFTVVGAYPNGRDWDLLKGEPNDRPKADRNIAAVSLPETDPFTGKKGGLLLAWE